MCICGSFFCRHTVAHVANHSTEALLMVLQSVYTRRGQTPRAVLSLQSRTMIIQSKLRPGSACKAYLLVDNARITALASRTKVLVVITE